MLISCFSDRRGLILLGAVSAVIITAVGGGLWYVDSRGGGAHDLAKSADARDRHKAIERLRESSGDAARRTLRSLSRDPDRWVAIRAVRAIGEHRGEAGRKALTEIMADRKVSARARGEAAAVLGHFKDADPSPLTEMLSRDPNAEARAGAAKGLVRMRNPKAIPQLVRALEDRDERVRRWAITAIHKMIARRFPYDAKLPPDRQRPEIERIKAYLRKCGAL